MEPSEMNTRTFLVYQGIVNRDLMSMRGLLYPSASC